MMVMVRVMLVVMVMVMAMVMVMVMAMVGAAGEVDVSIDCQSMECQKMYIPKQLGQHVR